MRWWHGVVVWAWAVLSLVFVGVLWRQGLFDGIQAWGLVIVSVFIADAGSYLFHYVVDHYGHPRSGGLVYEFQRHHLLPDGIVGKSLPEILFPAARIVLPLELLLFAWTSTEDGVGWWALVLFVLGSCWVLAQLCHRWSHRPPGSVVRMLQAAGLLVSPVAHRCHHRAPYDSHFAVITGWSNPVFDRLGLPRGLDVLMHRLGFEKRGLIRNLQMLEMQE